MSAVYDQMPYVQEAVFDKIASHQQDAAGYASKDWLKAERAISDVRKAVERIPVVAMPSDYMASVVATLNTHLANQPEGSCGQEFLKALKTDLGKMNY